MSSTGWVQGQFTPKNPEKYKGDVNKIIFRSSWELHFATFLDNNVNVIEWSSEELVIMYYNPVLQRVAKYYPDFVVTFQDKDGDVVTEVIEIKPSKQVSKPTSNNLREQQTWAVNVCKWQSAVKYCAAKQIRFRILTENSVVSITN